MSIIVKVVSLANININLFCPHVNPLGVNAGLSLKKGGKAVALFAVD